MKLEFTNLGGIYTAHISDKLTFTDHGMFRKLIEDVRDVNPEHCVFDLADLESIDSSGLGMIMIAIDEAKKGTWTLSIKNAKGPVRQLLQLSKLDRLLQVA